MKDHVRSIYRRSPVATVWHPAAKDELLDTPHGNVRVCVGEPAYQLATGEMKEL